MQHHVIKKRFSLYLVSFDDVTSPCDEKYRNVNFKKTIVVWYYE